MLTAESQLLEQKGPQRRGDCARTASGGLRIVEAYALLGISTV